MLLRTWETIAIEVMISNKCRVTHFQSDHVFRICKIMQIRAAITQNYIFARIFMNINDMSILTMFMSRFTV